MNHWIQDIINFLFPAVCHVCDTKLAPHEKFVCTGCLSSLPRTGFHRITLNPMEERFAGQFPFERGTGLFFYSRGSALSTIVQDMKYRHFPAIGDMLGRTAAKELFSTGFFNDIEAVTYVPMHWFKQAQRGYNQAFRIARGISEEIDCPVVDALRMTRQRKTQTRLSVTERIKNAENLFAPIEKIDLTGKNVLLVDDICTTGTTLGSAAKCLTDRWPGIKLTLLAIGVTF